MVADWLRWGGVTGRGSEVWNSVGPTDRFKQQRIRRWEGSGGHPALTVTEAESA